MSPRPTIPPDDLYARLEVPTDATAEAIEIAWRALLKRHHPDVAGSAALEVAKRINVAHDWLSDPALRERYDTERRVGGVRVTRRPREPRSPAGPPTGATSPSTPRRRADPRAAVRGFLERVGRLSPVELDRLSVAETTSIAFVASIHRFLTPSQRRALEELESAVRARLNPADWAVPAIRDAILAAGHELVIGPFLDEHLAEPFRGRARDRLMRGWEAAIAQPRYGPNTAAVERFLERVAALDPAALERLVRVAGRGRIPTDPWPAGLDPDEDGGLRVSSALAARDVVVAAAGLRTLDRATSSRASRLLGRTAHALVLRHAFRAADLDDLLAPWRAATGDGAVGRPGPGPDAAEASVRRR